MITVLTPTYNRADLLGDLYKSLISQTDKRFEWLVVDDGSTDHTKKIIDKYQAENKIKIRYVKKSNGGKHTALNVGFSDEILREWVFVVDSDDFLSLDCIEKLCSEIEIIPSDFNSIRILQRYKESENLRDKYPENFRNYFDLINSNINSDNADVFRKSALNGFVFPAYDGESFMAESPLYIWLGKKGLTKFMNYEGYVSEYLEGGLSDNSIKNRHKCFNSTAYIYYNQYMTSELSYKKRLRAATNWWRFRLFKNNFESKNKVPFLYLPVGFLLFIKDYLNKAIY